MRHFAVGVLLAAFGVLIVCSPVMAAPGVSLTDMGTYDRLAAYQEEKVNVLSQSLLGFAVPGWAQFRRQSTLEGIALVLIEVGSFVFMFDTQTVTEGGNTYNVLAVNWWLVGLVVANHLYSGVSSTIWANRWNQDLYLRYDVEKITFGIRF